MLDDLPVAFPKEVCHLSCWKPKCDAVMKQQRASEDGFWQMALVLAYSIRNACIGSIRDALHAGTRQARAATTSMDAATDAKIAGSSGRVPKSIDWIKRTAPMLATRPIVSP